MGTQKGMVNETHTYVASTSVIASDVELPPESVGESAEDAAAMSSDSSITPSSMARAWAQLRAEEQEALVKPLIGLLSREWHRLQASTGLNVVQGWLQALLACRPMPKIPAAVLQYLGKTFNAWHLAIPMLEHHARHLAQVCAAPLPCPCHAPAVPLPRIHRARLCAGAPPPLAHQSLPLAAQLLQ